MGSGRRARALVLLSVLILFVSAIFCYQKGGKNSGSRSSSGLQNGLITAQAMSQPALPTISDIGKTEEALISQKDFFGNQISIAVEKKQEGEGYRYYLADALRNINVLNNTKDIKGKGKTAGVLISEYSQVEKDVDVFTDLVAVSIFYNLVTVWDFYANDEEGSEIVIRGTDPANPCNYIRGDARERGEREIVALAHYDTNWENAGYFPEEANTKLKDVFAFGDGKPETFSYLGTALDVVAHEYQHAVTAKITPLTYEGESGALNESFSDIFGMIASGYEMDDYRFWLVGEEVASSAIGGCIRDISNPSRMGHPTNVAERYIDTSGNNNNRQVHYNSLITSHAMYAMYRRAEEEGFAFTKSLVRRLYYTTLTLMSPTSDFSEFGYLLTLATHYIDFEDGADSERLYDIVVYGLTYVGIEESEVVIPSREPITITYFDMDGIVIREDSVIWAEQSITPSATNEITRGMYRYLFSHWEKNELENGDIQYRAVYRKILTESAVALIATVIVFALFDIGLFAAVLYFRINKGGFKPPLGR